MDTARSIHGTLTTTKVPTFTEQGDSRGRRSGADCFSSTATNSQLRGPHAPLARAQVRRRLTLGVNGGTTQKFLELTIFRRNPPADGLVLGGHTYLTRSRPW